MPWTGEGEGGAAEEGEGEGGGGREGGGGAASGGSKKKKTQAEGATSSTTIRRSGPTAGGGGRIGTAEEPEELKRLLRIEKERSSRKNQGNIGEWRKSRREDSKEQDIRNGGHHSVVKKDDGGTSTEMASREVEEEEQIGMVVWEEEDHLAEEETYLAEPQVGISVEERPMRIMMSVDSLAQGSVNERLLPEVPLNPPWEPSAVEAARSALARAKEDLEGRDAYKIEMMNELFQHDNGPIARLAKEWESQLDTYGWDVAKVISNLGARYRAPHMDARRIWDLLHLTASGELVAMEAKEGVRVPIRQELAELGGEAQDLEARLAYGAHRSALVHGAHVENKIVSDLVRGWAGIVPSHSWRKIKGLALSPLGAVARKEKVRVVHDLTFAINGDIAINELADRDMLPPCDIGNVFDKFVERAYGLRLLFPEEHLVMRTSDIAEAFRIKHMALADVPKFSYAWKGFIILDLRLQFGYCGAPGHFQRHSSAMIEAHNMTRWDDPCMEEYMHDPVITNFLTIEEGWDASRITNKEFPKDQEFLKEFREKYTGSMMLIDNAGIYIDDAWEIEINCGDRLLRSAANMLRVHYEALGYPGQDGPGPISLKKYGGWASVGDLLGLRIDLNKMMISLPQDKVIKARELLAEFPPTRLKSTYKEIMSLIGRLRHYAFCIRPGRYFLRRMINVTLLGEGGGVGRRSGRREIILDSEFHADIAWWSKLLDLHAQNPDQYSLPIFAHVRRAADIQVIGDASGSAGGGVITGLGIWWRVEWPEAIKERLLATNKTRGLSAEKDEQSVSELVGEKRRSTMLTIAHLELLVLVLGVATMITHLGTTRPLSVLALCDNSNAVSWHRKAGARCPKASALIRILGELETRYRVYLNARHLPGVQNTHADAISRLSQTEASSYMRTVTGAEGRPDLARKERYKSETLTDNYIYEQVPESWIKRAYGCL